MKAQETHLMVNSRLKEWMEAQSSVALSKGRAEGVASELARATAEGKSKGELSVALDAKAALEVQVMEHMQADAEQVKAAGLALPMPKEDKT
jgi:hypothetical protein